MASRRPRAAERLILGIDPGTAVTGFGVVSRRAAGESTLIECGAIRTPATTSLPLRLRAIFQAVSSLLDKHRPYAMAVENVFQGRNVRSALTLGHARGVVLLAGSLTEVEIAEYAPREIKSAVAGTGNATKDQVGYMVRRHLRLRETPKPADAADGVAAALCHALLGSFPASTRDVHAPGGPVRRPGAAVPPRVP